MVASKASQAGDGIVTEPSPFCDVISNSFYKSATTCFESRDLTARDDVKTAVLYAEGMGNLIDKTHPNANIDLLEAFLPYDEPLYLIPVGASIFYLVLLAWLIIFYVNYFGRKMLARIQRKLDLHPELKQFPNLPLYWVQQSKREVDLRREVRNTWAWLARRYLLSPNDPLLTNVDQILGLFNWHDFEMSKSNLSVLKFILASNALYVKVNRRGKGEKDFELVKEADILYHTTNVTEEVKENRFFEDKRMRNSEWSVASDSMTETDEDDDARTKRRSKLGSRSLSTRSLSNPKVGYSVPKSKAKKKKLGKSTVVFGQLASEAEASEDNSVPTTSAPPSTVGDSKKSHKRSVMASKPSHSKRNKSRKKEKKYDPNPADPEEKEKLRSASEGAIPRDMDGANGPQQDNAQIPGEVEAHPLDNLHLGQSETTFDRPRNKRKDKLAKRMQKKKHGPSQHD